MAAFTGNMEMVGQGDVWGVEDERPTGCDYSGMDSRLAVLSRCHCSCILNVPELGIVDGRHTDHDGLQWASCRENSGPVFFSECQYGNWPGSMSTSTSCGEGVA